MINDTLEKQIIEACKYGDLEQVKEFLSKGVDINFNDSDPLRWASQYGHLNIVKYLIGNGAIFNKKKVRALSWAQLYDKKDIVEYLRSLL